MIMKNENALKNIDLNFNDILHQFLKCYFAIYENR